MPTTPLIYTNIANTAAVNIPSAAEALVATVGGIAPTQPNQAVKLHAFVAIALQAAVDRVQFTLYRDSLAGFHVATSPTLAAVGGATKDFVWDAIDYAGEFANGVYALGVVLGAAAGASTVVAFALTARVD